VDQQQLLESSWADRGRAVRGRELRLELVMTAVFGIAVAALLAASGSLTAPEPIAALLVAAYAVAARAEFPIGSGHMVPTQLFLIPLFAVAPPALVPALVYAGLAVGLLGEVALRRSRADRLVYCGGDAMHALGPALVLTVLADGDPFSAAAWVLALAFAAQLTLDFVSSSVHDRLVFGTRPELHVRVVLQVWAIDAVLTPIGLLAAEASQLVKWAVLAPLPLVALLSAMSVDRSRRIAQAWERLEELNRERHRREAAVRRVGEALASNLDLDGLLELVGRAATEALDGERGRAVAAPGRPAPGPVGALLAEAELRALEAGREPAALARDGTNAIAGVIGNEPAPVGVISVARATPFSDDERALLGYLCGQAAVSAANLAGHELLRAAEAQLRHQAFHDGLTGLPNRALFADRVGHALSRAARGHTAPAVVFIDLDGFKLVNDTLGHAAGDELLIGTAQRIRDCLRQGDTAARLGGDEFAVLLEDLDEPDQAHVVAERLRHALRAPANVRDHECRVRASIGVAFPGPDGDAESVLRRADLAMYAAKQRGGDRVTAFELDMLAHADARTELATDLHAAIALGQVGLHFQPIVDMVDGSALAVEALARWRHPRRGLLAADAFIPIAEQTGLIDELGRVLLDAACRAAASWPEGEHGAPKVAVNVSSAQLRAERFAGDVAAALECHGLRPERLIVEITESVAMASDPETRATLAALRALGVGLALDDFGTGYSSLSHLARTNVDLLKLDRAFLAGIDGDAAQARLLEGVLQLAASLGVSVVAEGIERWDQRDRVLELGGRIGQGYLLGAPVAADEALAAVQAASDRVTGDARSLRSASPSSRLTSPDRNPSRRAVSATVAGSPSIP
jgi:diguanylate cyclase (GGDEF)-like protein